jgi:hypothetical protein
VTDKPQLEPCFAAAFHGIELSFLLLAEFLRDTRRWGQGVAGLGCCTVLYCAECAVCA